MEKLFDEKADRIVGWAPRGQIYIDFYYLKKGVHEIDDDSQVFFMYFFLYALFCRFKNIFLKNPFFTSCGYNDI